MSSEQLIKKFNIDKELEFINGISFIKEKYGNKFFMDWYWKPQKYKNGLPIIKKKNILFQEIKQIHTYLENPRIHSKDDKKMYYNNLKNIIKKMHFKFDKYLSNDLLKLQHAAVYRYYIIDALSNISLSVSPEIKKKWKINFELFGAFYNTDYNYCGLFSDIESSCCDFFTFTLEKNMNILINPPYTEKWIKLSCKIINNIMNKNKNTKIFLIIPVWNTSDRKTLGLNTQYGDLPEIDKLKTSSYLQSHEITNLTFYNGIIKKYIHLKDNVHVFIFQN